jgi:hypothetical protein
MALLLKASGAIVDLIPGNRRVFTLPELQTAVGGYIELVRAPEGLRDVDGDPMWLVINEDGKRFQLAINTCATVLYHRAGGRPDDVVVGDVILGTHAELGGGDEEGDEAE